MSSRRFAVELAHTAKDASAAGRLSTGTGGANADSGLADTGISEEIVDAVLAQQIIQDFTAPSDLVELVVYLCTHQAPPAHRPPPPLDGGIVLSELTQVPGTRGPSAAVRMDLHGHLVDRDLWVAADRLGGSTAGRVTQLR